MVRLSSLLVLVMTLGLSPLAMGKSSVKKLHLKKIARDANLHTKPFNFKFERVWFYSLNSTQRKVYLDTLSQLSVKFANKSYSQLSPVFLQYLIEKANAEDFNVGYVIPTGVSYAQFFSQLMENDTFKSMSSQCSGGTYPCAAYTCMQKVGAQYKFCCSPNSTKACVDAGKSAVNQQARQSFFDTCESNSSSAACQMMESIIGDESDKINKHCENRKAKEHCIKAAEAMEKEGVPIAPFESERPEGKNCDAVSDQLANHRNARGANEKNINSHANNTFWNNILQAARKTCGENKNWRSIIGTCNVSGHLAKVGTGKRVRTYTVENNPEKYAECRNARMGQRQKTFKDSLARQQRALQDAMRNIRRGVRTDYWRRQRDNIQAEIRKIENERSDYLALQKDPAKRPSECSMLADRETRFDPNVEPLNVADLGQDVWGQVRAGGDISEINENKFRAITGLSTGRFKSLFCNAKSHDRFSQGASYINKRYQGLLGVGEDEGSKAVLASRARVANHRIQACFAHLKDSYGQKCKFYDIDNPQLLKTLNQKPMMFKDKETGKCYLAKGYEQKPVGSDNRLIPHIRMDDLDGDVFDVTKNLNAISDRYYVKDFRCEGDKKRGLKYVQPEDKEILGLPEDPFQPEGSEL